MSDFCDLISLELSSLLIVILSPHLIDCRSHIHTHINAHHITSPRLDHPASSLNSGFEIEIESFEDMHISLSPA